jgi:hypothetical protein
LCELGRRPRADVEYGLNARPDDSGSLKLRRLAALTAAIGLLFGAQAMPSRAGFNVATDRIYGMSMYTEGKLLLGALLDMGRVAKLGVNTVVFDTWWEVGSGSDAVERKLLKTVDDNLLRNAMRQARAKGMRVALMPKFATAGPGRGWRGDFVPQNGEVFWASYRKMINHYAEIAREEGASLFFVGSEMAALDTHEAQWRRVIAEVRSRFKGFLSYNENQDATRPTRVRFWDALDIVATTGYFPLNGVPSPQVSTLVEGWKRSGLPKLVDMHHRTGKPVMIGEIGYMATSYVGKAPYDGTEYDYRPEMQLNAYQALLQTMYQYSWYAGEFWWSWNGNEYRTPKDKPAEDLLRAWYKWGWRPDGSSFPNFTGLPLPIPLPQIP